MNKSYIKFRSLLILHGLILLSSSSIFKLDKSYSINYGSEIHYLNFITKEDFEITISCCLNLFKATGNFEIKKDTIFLNFKHYQNKVDKDTWVLLDTIKMKSSNYEYIRINYMKNYTKLLRLNNKNLRPINNLNNSYEFVVNEDN